jgi:lipoprotein-anchoring transpeptidase ErfK/SrfK
VLPGLVGQGAGAIVPDPGKGSPQGATQGNTTPPEPGQSQTPVGASGASGEQKQIDKDTYWIDVDVTAQTVEIMQGEKAIKTMTASTGIEGKETPLGTFEIQNRGEWFFSEKYQQGAKYWVSFKDWGIYLFHTLAMDKDQKVIPEEAEKLGQPASHGCVRLPIEDAKWIYDNIPQKTKVVIHK